jgi:hypothetical protein
MSKRDKIMTIEQLLLHLQTMLTTGIAPDTEIVVQRYEGCKYQDTLIISEKHPLVHRPGFVAIRSYNEITK